MSHLFDSGMFFRKPAWHQLGNVVAEWPGSWSEARRLASLEWDPVELPLEHNDEDTGKKILARSDNNAFLSVVSDRYVVISNTEMGNMIDFLLDSEKDIHYETLISLDRGRKVVAVLYFSTPLKIDKDPSQTFPYLAVINYHDGTGGLRVLPTAVRIVCANTLSLALDLDNKVRKPISIRHSVRWVQQAQEAQEEVRNMRTGINVTTEKLNALAAQKVAFRFPKEWMDEFLPPLDDKNPDITHRMINNREVERDKFMRYWNSETCDGTRDSKLGIAYATLEFMDWGNRKKTDNRAASTLASMKVAQSKHDVLDRLARF